jgi:deoxycytidine triphosphate deaminase
MLTDNRIRERLDEGSFSIENLGSLDEQLQSVGVDLRVGPDYIQAGSEVVVDADRSGGLITFEPKEYYKVHTIESVSLPNDLAGQLSERSTLVRAGLGVRTSGIINPGWEGVLEFGVYNFTDEQISVEVGWPLVHLSLHELDESVGVPYGSKSGARYQGQEGVSGPQGFGQE